VTETMGEHGNCAADDMRYGSIGHFCGLATETNDVRPGSRDAFTSHEGGAVRAASLYLSAVNGRHYTAIA
jgi:hypothetical protein